MLVAPLIGPAPAPPRRGSPSAIASAVPSYDLAAQRAKIARIRDGAQHRLPQRRGARGGQSPDPGRRADEPDLSAPAPSPTIRRIRAEIARSAAIRRRPACSTCSTSISGPGTRSPRTIPSTAARRCPPAPGFYPDRPDARRRSTPISPPIPAEREALTSPYTVVQRQGDRLVAVPYSEEYRAMARAGGAAARAGRGARRATPACKNS